MPHAPIPAVSARSISFEREAYANDMDFTYLKRRKLFAAWRYYFRWEGDN